MAHHLAELIRSGESATSEDEKKAAQDRACATILQLWAHRSKLPGRVDPLKRYEQAITCLNELSADANPWRGQHAANKREQFALQINDALNDITLGTILVGAASEGELSSENEELAASFLGPDDNALLRMLEARLAKLADEPVPQGVQAEVQPDEPAQPLDAKIKKQLAKRIDQAAALLKDLKLALDEPAAKAPIEPIDSL